MNVTVFGNRVSAAVLKVWSQDELFRVRVGTKSKDQRPDKGQIMRRHTERFA